MWKVCGIKSESAAGWRFFCKWHWKFVKKLFFYSLASSSKTKRDIVMSHKRWKGLHQTLRWQIPLFFFFFSWRCRLVIREFSVSSVWILQILIKCRDIGTTFPGDTEGNQDFTGWDRLDQSRHAKHYEKDDNRSTSKHIVDPCSCSRWFIQEGGISLLQHFFTKNLSGLDANKEYMICCRHLLYIT